MRGQTILRAWQIIDGSRCILFDNITERNNNIAATMFYRRLEVIRRDGDAAGADQRRDESFAVIGCLLKVTTRITTDTVSLDIYRNNACVQ